MIFKKILSDLYEVISLIIQLFKISNMKFRRGVVVAILVDHVQAEGDNNA